MILLWGVRVLAVRRFRLLGIAFIALSVSGAPAFAVNPDPLVDICLRTLLVENYGEPYLLLELTDPKKALPLNSIGPNASRARLHYSGLDFAIGVGGVGSSRGRHKNETYSGTFREPVLARMAEMAERGLVLDLVWAEGREKGELTLGFRRNVDIIPATRLPSEPEWLAGNRKLLNDTFVISKKHIEPFEDDDVPPPGPSGIFLSAITLPTLAPGTWRWVLLRGENFLRVGPEDRTSHSRLGGWELAEAAGKLTIECKNGLNEVVTMNDDTTTYEAETAFIRNGVAALWRQGIFPKSLTINRWDRKAGLNVPLLKLMAP